MASGILKRLLSCLRLSRKTKDKVDDEYDDHKVPKAPEKLQRPSGYLHRDVLTPSGTEDRSPNNEHRSLSNERPPAYTERLISTTNDYIVTERQPSSFIQICPHETLSFSRYQRILALPNFKYNNTKLDALTPTSAYHHRGHDKITKECQDSCKPLNVSHSPGFVAKLKGFGTYTYKARRPWDHDNGLLLSFHWEMKCLDSYQVKYRTASELQGFLQKTGIWLCPHKKISDMDIVNAIHPIINPNGRPVDPIDRYLAKEGVKNCARCGTRIKVYARLQGSEGKTCRVDTSRSLGVGTGVEDALWRGQCQEESVSYET